MNLELLAGFCAAVAVLALIPGPAVGAITATALSHGTRAALATVLGGMIAISLQMALLVGFAASAFQFLNEAMPVIRWAGVAYLVWLGVESWRRAGRTESNETGAPPRRGWWLRGFVVNATNPKTLAFHAAFFPQFIDGSLPLVPQVALLGGAYFVVLGTIDCGWALAGGRIYALFRSERARRWRDRASGGLLMGAAAGLAAVRTG